jgi:hypothetical protein
MIAMQLEQLINRPMPISFSYWTTDMQIGVKEKPRKAGQCFPGRSIGFCGPTIERSIGVIYINPGFKSTPRGRSCAEPPYAVWVRGPNQGRYGIPSGNYPRMVAIRPPRNRSSIDWARCPAVIYRSSKSADRMTPAHIACQSIHACDASAPADKQLCPARAKYACSTSHQPTASRLYSSPRSAPLIWRRSKRALPGSSSLGRRFP